MTLDSIRLDLLVAILDGNDTLRAHLFDAWVAFMNIEAFGDA